MRALRHELSKRTAISFLPSLQQSPTSFSFNTFVQPKMKFSALLAATLASLVSARALTYEEKCDKYRCVHSSQPDLAPNAPILKPYHCVGQGGS